ncbi:DUF4013 domain-containing protein [Halorubrum ezzemoulense]|jgi:hypothetical protein|uniref:DUF4013 domain-containing protein n=1 Tax=Halorubrum TaxID=56688 RepID=UPI0010F5CAA8|nr:MULTISPECIES: DUF4013 domain-containing protein [Halorubrum]MDB2237363.1 DUF4013 domain-containing protein [Halorubrum ezzemoulense]MDB2246687.1 DUF4013 domain-containing protein [Halorubrum ezzemoulense]MDB9247515.1 DUF4013 domain-containing protein [Halorubrum ezzemoulense]MDB9258576.1 DUF4013 domain-containing protein [Halorubrum ezzemoulense]MDB9261062.1 DUF4013 domain-containing protein [Halorubrum ezzemoulense]
MIEDGLSYPVRGDWVGRMVVGGVLGLLSVLVIPTFLVFGYLVRVLERTVAGDDEPPEFDDWGDLLAKGVVGALIALAYSVVPVVLYVVLVTVVAGIGSGVGGDLGALIGVTGALLALAFLPVLLFVYYAVPAALTAYAVRGRAGAAFDVDLLKPTLFSADYLLAVLAPILVAIGVFVVSVVLLVTVVGSVLVPFVQFYGQVAVFRMFGAAFADRTDGIDAGRESVGDAATA